jgi:hypothetical protein
MVPAVKPVIELAKLPVPVPSIVLELAIVGAVVVLQQTPLAVTVKPPSLLIIPPETAEVEAILEIVLVVIVGRDNSPEMQRIENPHFLS